MGVAEQKWLPLISGSDLNAQNRLIEAPNIPLGHVKGGYFNEHRRTQVGRLLQCAVDRKVSIHSSETFENLLLSFSLGLYQSSAAWSVIMWL